MSVQLAQRARGLGVQAIFDPDGYDQMKTYWFGGGYPQGYAWGAENVPVFGGYSPKLIEPPIGRDPYETPPIISQQTIDLYGTADSPIVTDADREIVRSYYKAYLHRGEPGYPNAPSSADIDFWARKLASDRALTGGDENAAIANLQRAFETSDEYMKLKAQGKEGSAPGSTIFGIPTWIAVPTAFVIGAVALGGND